MLTETEARELVKGEFGRRLLKTAASYTAPLYWIFQDKLGEPKKVNNGTIFFIDCGEGPIAITAAHVYSGYLHQKKRTRISVCRILNEDFNLEENLIDINNDENIDIATFKITEETIKKIGKIILTPIINIPGNSTTDPKSFWPPPPPEKGKGVFFAGFPGQARIQEEIKKTKTTKINFGIYAALETATNVDEKSISCHFTEDKIDTFGLGLPESGYDLGGISGAPLLTLYQNPLIHWSLGGIIRQAVPEWELLYATRADFILPNGKLKS